MPFFYCTGEEWLIKWEICHYLKNSCWSDSPYFCIWFHATVELTELPASGVLRQTLHGSLFPSTEIEKFQKGEGKDEEKYIDVVINKNMKLGQKVLIPVKQFPKVRWWGLQVWQT